MPLNARLNVFVEHANSTIRVQRFSSWLKALVEDQVIWRRWQALSE
jgi:hypothetical protein